MLAYSAGTFNTLATGVTSNLRDILEANLGLQPASIGFYPVTRNAHGRWDVV